MKKGRKDRAPAERPSEGAVEEVPVRIEERPPEAAEEGGPAEVLRERAERADEYFERLQRLQAEFDNYRKRVRREKEETLRWANEKLIADLLPVLDNFDRALSPSAAGSAESLRAGVEMIRKEMEKVLASAGLEPIEAEGTVFNPEIHEAIETVVRPDLPENTVVEERLRGYTLKGRLVRPAVVTVSAVGRPESGRGAG